MGLLYGVLRCFSDINLNIAHSRIATEKGAAFDSFYVNDVDGRKLTNQSLLHELRVSLLKAATGANMTLREGQ